MPDYTDHQIKINRAARLADVGRYPSTCSAMMRHLPAELVKRATPAEIKQARQTLGLTAKQLAPLLGYSRPASVYDIEAGRERASGAVVRLLRAYLDGYRPADWPA